jgi:uncharacterized protein (TIGR00369 family)
VSAPAPELVPMVLSGPEMLFGVQRITREPDGSLRSTQGAGPEIADECGRAQLSGLGVLVDDVLGYAVNQASPGWSASTEISVDVTGDVPSAGTVTCTGRVVHVDDAGALATGEVLDDAGDVVARCVLRGRFDDRRPDDAALASGASIRPPEVDRRTIDNVLGPDVRRVRGGLRVEVTERFLNPLGNLHGGMHLCLVERAGALAVPELGSTASLRLQLVRGVPGGSVLDVRGSVVHLGRTLAVVHVAATDQDGRVCALGAVVRH